MGTDRGTDIGTEIWTDIGAEIWTDISPGHTLRCCTPAIVGSKRAAMPKNHMRCAAIESSTCLIFCSRFWDISAIYYYAIYTRFSAL